MNTISNKIDEMNSFIGECFVSWYNSFLSLVYSDEEDLDYEHCENNILQAKTMEIRSEKIILYSENDIEKCNLSNNIGVSPVKSCMKRSVSKFSGLNDSEITESSHKSKKTKTTNYQDSVDAPISLHFSCMETTPKFINILMIPDSTTPNHPKYKEGDDWKGYKYKAGLGFI